MITKVFVNGTFDLIHEYHIHLLNYAKNLGDYVLVAIDSTERVTQLKGATRPVNSLYTRTTILENIKSVDEVKSFSSDTELESIILNYQPDIMIVGSDYQNKNIVGSQYAKQLVYFNRDNSVSTTQILDSYFNRRLLQ